MIEIRPHESLVLAARGWPRGREGARRDSRTRLALVGFAVRDAAGGAAAGAGGARPPMAVRRCRPRSVDLLRLLPLRARLPGGGRERLLLFAPVGDPARPPRAEAPAGGARQRRAAPRPVRLRHRR